MITKSMLWFAGNFGLSQIGYVSCLWLCFDKSTARIKIYIFDKFTSRWRIFLNETTALPASGASTRNVSYRDRQQTLLLLTEKWKNGAKRPRRPAFTGRLHWHVCFTQTPDSRSSYWSTKSAFAPRSRASPLRLTNAAGRDARHRQTARRHGDTPADLAHPRQMWPAGLQFSRKGDADRVVNYRYQFCQNLGEYGNFAAVFLSFNLSLVTSITKIFKVVLSYYRIILRWRF